LTWAQSLRGNALELVEPTVEQVDFREIAETLATLNRYTGCAQIPISVAQHTIICCENAPVEIRPWILLHDCHEAGRVGDIGTPQLEAFCKIAEQMYGLTASDIVRATIDEAKRRHDLVIHRAAGLPMPTPEQRAVIKRLDLAALATERRDFLNRSKRAWHPAVEAAQPFRKVYRYVPPAMAAESLYGAFCAYLPSLSGMPS